MKTVANILYRMLCHFSMAFTGIVLFFWTFMGDTGHTVAYISYERMKLFLIFALIFGVSSILFSVPKLPAIVRYALHFAVNTVGFMSTFVTVAKNEIQAFVVGVVFVIAYLVIALIAYYLKKLVSGEKNTEKAK